MDDLSLPSYVVVLPGEADGATLELALQLKIHGDATGPMRKADRAVAPDVELPPPMSDISAYTTGARPVARARASRKAPRKLEESQRLGAIGNASGMLNRRCCSDLCLSIFAVREVSGWRVSFYKMIKPNQDQLLWNLATDASIKPYYRRWMFLGKSVCRNAMLLLTGAPRRLKTFRKRASVGQTRPPIDMRKFNSKAGLEPKSADVASYLEDSIGRLGGCSSSRVTLHSILPRS